MSSEVELKRLASSLYSLCNELYPQEFKTMYKVKQSAFTEWLNGKTGLDVCQITNKPYAMKEWIKALTFIKFQKGQC